MFFEDIKGQEDAKRLLLSQIKTDKPSHAYIFDGEEGSGKMMLAEAFAAGMLCEMPDGKPCGQCHSCKQIMSHNHPDLIYVGHEKAGSLGVDDVRTGINASVDISPYSSKYKIYVVDDAQLMTPGAQNALLKTIEEPPEYVIIMLLTDNAGSFLQTILSRCIQIKMKPVDDETIKAVLNKELSIVDYRADVCVAFAQGNIGKAKKLASSEEFSEMKNAVVNLLKIIHKANTFDMTEFINVVSKDKHMVDDYLDLFTLWYRDVLLYKAGSGEKSLIFSDELFTIKTQSKRYSYSALNEIFEAIELVRKRINANVNFELTLELLLITFKEGMQ